MKPFPFSIFRAPGLASCAILHPGFPAALAALTLCVSSAYGADGSRTWTGATNGDYYNGANWSPSGDFPSGNAIFSGTVTNSTITKTGNSYEYIYGLIFGNTLSTQSSFTFSPGGTRFFVGGPSISTAVVTSGRLTDEIGVDVYLANAATAFDIGSNHDLKISGNVTAGATTVTKNGAGTLILSGTNTYSATTTAAAGTLLATKAAALSGYNSAGKVIFNGGTIGVQVAGSGWTTAEVDTLLTNATKTSGALGIDTTNGNLTQWTPFTAGSFGGLGLTKSGANTLTLDQVNTYTGTTSVTAGTLSLTGSLTGGGAISTSGTSVFSQSSTGVISGASSFTHGSTGTSILAGSNTYTGVTSVNAGTLKISHNAALGTTAGNTIVSGTGQLELSGGVTTAEPITISTGQYGAVTAAWSTNNTLAGAVTLTSTADFRLGPGITTLSGGVNSANNSGLGLNGRAVINTAPITIGTGQLGLTSNGLSAPTEINVADNTWGTTLLNFDGHVKLGAANVLPSTTNIEFGWTAKSFSTGTINLNGFDQTVASIGINSNSVGLGGDQNITGGGTLTVNLPSGTKTYEGRITDGATATALTKNGAGTQILKNLSGTASSYTGATTIHAGTLVAEGGTSIGDTSAVSLADAAGATLKLNSNETIGSLSGGGTTGGSVNLQANTLTTGGNNTIFAGIITGTGGSLIKTGSGIQTLSGTNTYSGPTTVSDGTLLVNNASGSGTGTGSVSVAGGATLGGTGVINPTGTNGISIASGGKLAPGASNAIGALALDLGTTTGGLAMASGSIFDWQLSGSGGASDQVSLWNYASGDLALNSNAVNLKLTGAEAAGNYTATLFKFYGDAGTTLTASGLSSGLNIGTLTGSFSGTPTFDYSTTGEIRLNYSVVPEPTSALAGLLLTAGLLSRRRSVV